MSHPPYTQLTDMCLTSAQQTASCQLQLQKRNNEKQDAQLSQRDRAAGCITVFAESRTLELGDNDLRTL